MTTSVDQQPGELARLRARVAELEQELSLRRAEQAGDLARLFEAAHDAIIVFDPQSEIILEANRQACELYGVERLVGESLDLFQSPERRGIDRTRDLLHPDGRGSIELEHRHRDGRLLLVEVSAAAVTFRGQDAVLSITRDVTERYRMQKQLRDSEERVRLLLDALPDFVVLKDGRGRWVEANQQAVERFGLVGIDYRGLCDEELAGLLPDRAEQFRSIAREDASAWRHEGVTQLQSERSGPEGERRFWDVLQVPVFWGDGRRRAMVIVGRDVTERHHASEELRRRGEHERRMLRELDHRVRNNLSALISLVRLSAERANDTDAFAGAIAGRLSAMAAAHGLLSQSHWTFTDLSELVKAVHPGECPGRFVAEGPPVEIAAARCSAMAMVLHELIANALKHGALGVDGGTVHCRWKVRGSGEQRDLVIEWTERGGPQPLAAPEEGTGVSLLRGLVRSDLGGTLSLSFPGTGAAHRLELTDVSAER